ncbi:MAG: hypothetical protein Kow0031_33170 [Anaerolineae bacterium]
MKGMDSLTNQVNSTAPALEVAPRTVKTTRAGVTGLLASQAAIGALFGGFVGVLYASLGWSVFMAALGAVTAISVEVVDRVFYHQRIAAGGNPKLAAAASVVVCWLLGLAIVGGLLLWVTA